MRLLVAVDGSSQSIEAVRAVERFASIEEVVLLHAVEPPTAVFLGEPEAIVQPPPAELVRDLRERGAGILEQAASLLPSRAPSVARRLETASPADAILDAADKERVDLILMGARGLGRIEEIVFGSVSHRVLHHAPCPVLVVRGPLPAVRRILLPLQGEVDGDEALRFLGKSPFHFPIDVRVVTVLLLGDPLWPVDKILGDAAARREFEAARSFVTGVAEKLKALKYDATAETTLGVPAEAVLHEAESMKADLVVMGHRARSAVSRFLLGSVSHAVLHKWEGPIAVLR